MATIQNSSPFRELKPLPIPVERFPALKKIATKVALIACMSMFFSAAGLSLGLAEIGFHLITDGIIGGVLGGIIGVIMTIYVKFAFSIGEYRYKTLKELQGPHGDFRILSALKNLEDHLPGLEEFEKPYLNHFLHKDLTVVTALLNPSRPDVKKVWEAFLKHLDPLMDTSIEMRRLKGEQLKEKLGWLHSGKDTYGADLKQIEAIQKVSFKKPIPIKEMREKIAAHFQNQCALVRSERTGEVLGYGWYRRVGNQIQIEQIARHPGATHMKIGSQLLCIILRKLRKNTPVFLEVEKDHPIRKLFREWGFVSVKDSSTKMQLDWSRYNQLTSQQ